MKNIFKRTLLIFSLFSSLKSNSCPIFLYRNNELSELKGLRQDLKLLTYSKKTQSWSSQKIQIDASKGEDMDFSQRNKEWFQKPLADYDRFVFDVDDFEDSAPNISSICDKNYGPVYLLKNYLDPRKVAYLTLCKDSNDPHPNQEPINFTSDQATIHSKNYKYQFNQRNYLLFQSIKSIDQSTHTPIAKNSEITMYVNVNDYFKLNLDSNDISSNLEKMQNGPLGFNAGITFALNLLFFKINLSLLTYSSFYKDSAYIPMILYLPVDGSRYFNQDTGVYYHWDHSDTDEIDYKKTHMPIYDQNLYERMHKNPSYLKFIESSYCNRHNICKFKFYSNKTSPLIIELTLHSSLIQKGFFPILIEDFQEYKKSSKAELKTTTSPGHGQSAIYFNFSKLDAGDHAWDLWMKLGNKTEENSRCPHPIFLNRIKS